ncbi:pyridoxal phosphate-dependent aminotransferase [Kineosporia mesophila]|uniref:Pyridoxal phosphate-dependent aminotransferase n=1 Tax=Kineosporia mesophila TaxID=566012 RepID=A0ABP6ZN74_9ACTN|nr:aminotransferase class I/II-fold pyridoxal phosphate-dependent enzyme [Kineosporia mesophila]MCD5355112.1 aminotransferase class I/II-fold pyridoxal phosphate-dependent enzyme [Kineosporia mesophila]
MSTASVPASLTRHDLPEMAEHIGQSVRAAERELENTTVAADQPFLDATYADTHRFPPPEWALPTFTTAASGEGMTYTPYRGDHGVRGTVTSNVNTVLGIPADDVILTPGTQGALFVALASILSPGDTVLLPDPDYLSTERMLRYFGAEVIRIPVIMEVEGRPLLDPDALRAAAAKGPRLMVFSHPNNPTGMIYTDETLELIAELAGRHDFTVLADQLYCRLVYDGETYTNFAALPGMAERTVTLLGPSKTESLSGYRLGVATAPGELLARMEDVQSCTALRAPAYAQHLLGRWLADDQEFVAGRIKEYQALRDRTVEVLNGSGLFRVRPAYGSAYVFPKLLVDVPDQQVAIALKRDAGIVVNPGYQFGVGGLGHLRLCFAQDEAAWDHALERIVSVVGNLARGA